MDFCYYNVYYSYVGSAGVKIKSKGNSTIRSGTAVVVPFSVMRIVRDCPENIILNFFNFLFKNS